MFKYCQQKIDISSGFEAILSHPFKFPQNYASEDLTKWNWTILDLISNQWPTTLDLF